MTNNPQSSSIPDHASNLSVLVNPDQIRSSIKRLFHNRIDEVVAELFQNSQRSGSTTVDITTTENGFTIQDNLTIDTKLWWTDPGYYSVWFERMVTLDQPVTGLRISVLCSPELVKALHDSLTPKDQILQHRRPDL